MHFVIRIGFELGEHVDWRDEWLTVAEVAARLQLTEDTIRRWCQSGRLQATLLNRRAGYRIPASELRRLLQGEQHSIREPAGHYDSGQSAEAK